VILAGFPYATIARSALLSVLTSQALPARRSPAELQ
jgi:hypothetical protein